MKLCIIGKYVWRLGCVDGFLLGSTNLPCHWWQRKLNCHFDTWDVLMVLLQIGLDGIRMLDPNTSRTLRIYPLDSLTRWEVSSPACSYENNVCFSVIQICTVSEINVCWCLFRFWIQLYLHSGQRHQWILKQSELGWSQAVILPILCLTLWQQQQCRYCGNTIFPYPW